MPANRKAEVDAAVADVDFAKNSYQVLLDTTHGPIRLNLTPDVAPGHCKNMIGLARIGFYDGVTFHRIIQSFMIQGGCPQGTGTGGPGYMIKAEFNKTSHEPGVLSMARTSDPNSAGSQFFICTGRHAHLDGQYTAFGKTADEESLATVRKIAATPVGANDAPRTPVKITKATVTATGK
jgi:peptidyl-prolyl cis-trans isomerase B (cyclophilin B)